MTTTTAPVKDITTMTISAMIRELSAIARPWVAVAADADMAYWFIRVDATTGDYITLACPTGAAVEIETAGYMIRSNDDFS
jgi:hypothetical protein